MNKGKQWKWSKKVRKEMEKQGKPPMKINLLPETLFSPAEKKLMKKTEVAHAKIMKIIGQPNSLLEDGGDLYYCAFKNKFPRPKRFKGLCLNWPKEVKK